MLDINPLAKSLSQIWHPWDDSVIMLTRLPKMEAQKKQPRKEGNTAKRKEKHKREKEQEGKSRQTKWAFKVIHIMQRGG